MCIGKLQPADQIQPTLDFCALYEVISCICKLLDVGNEGHRTGPQVAVKAKILVGVLRSSLLISAQDRNNEAMCLVPQRRRVKRNSKMLTQRTREPCQRAKRVPHEHEDTSLIPAQKQNKTAIKTEVVVYVCHPQRWGGKDRKIPGPSWTAAQCTWLLLGQ